MKTTINIVAVLLLVVGTLWILQGRGLVGGSFMTGDRTWLWTGVAVDLLGIGMLIWNNRPRSLRL